MRHLHSVCKKIKTNIENIQDCKELKKWNAIIYVISHCIIRNYRDGIFTFDIHRISR